MSKRLSAALLALAMMLASGGCTPVIEHEYVAVTDHKVTSSAQQEPEGPVLEAENYTQLRNAVADLVASREEHGTVRLVGYERDVESDVASACMDVANNTPMGAYAVYYITSNVSKIVSYYEAEITVTYKRTAAQMSSVSRAESDEALREAIRGAMSAYDQSLAVAANVSEVTEALIAPAIEELYYGDPSLTVVYPEAAVTSYPQSGADRIFEISFSYIYLKTSLVTMGERLLARAKELADAAEKLDAPDALLYLAGTMADTVEFEEESWDGGAGGKSRHGTAYDALVRGSSTGEGFAMAFKLVCDELGVESVVVRGRRGGTDYCWNMARLNGDWYHIDAGRCAADGLQAGFLKNDGAMSGEYLWDAAKYPACAGELTYESVAGVPEEASAETASPAALISARMR